MTTKVIYNVYQAIFPSGKSYIGKTNNLKKRKQKHINLALSGSNKCPIFYPAIRKYGKDIIKWNILYTTTNEIDSYEKEVYYIALHNTNVLREDSFGYNASDGGRGGMQHKTSQKTKDKHSIISKKLWQDPEFIKKQRSGFNTSETKAKISKQAQCNWNNPEYKKMQTDARSTKECSDNHSAGAKKMWSSSKDSRRNNLINRNAKTYKVTYPDGQIENITNFKLFCIKYNLSYGACFACKNRGTKHKGYFFENIEV